MSLKEELQAEQVVHLNLSNFCQVASGTAVHDVLATMRQAGSAVCLVMDNGRLAGIFTERDVLQKVAAEPETWSLPVDQMMITAPVTIAPQLAASSALKMMDEHHFRSLPVIDQAGQILGTMTHRAIIDFLATRFPADVLNRPPHPGQFPRKAEGG